MLFGARFSKWSSTDLSDFSRKIERRRSSQAGQGENGASACVLGCAQISSQLVLAISNSLNLMEHFLLATYPPISLGREQQETLSIDDSGQPSSKEYAHQITRSGERVSNHYDPRTQRDGIKVWWIVYKDYRLRWSRDAARQSEGRVVDENVPMCAC